MKPYYEDDACTIYHGEAVAVLGSLPEASVDVVLTRDPKPLTCGCCPRQKFTWDEFRAHRCRCQEVR